MTETPDTGHAADLAPDGATDKAALNDFLGAPPESPARKWIIRGGIAFAVLILALLLSRCFAGEAQTSYVTQEVERGDLTVTVTATGNLKPVNQVDVGSEQSGLITQVLVDVNDRVLKGQLLASLDTSRLSETVAQTRAQVMAAQAQVAQAQAQAALAQATLTRQEQVFNLSGGKVPSKTELDSARAQALSARANVNAAQAQVAVSRAQLSSAQINLSKAQIVSPVNGVVLRRNVEPGQTVAASLNAPVLFTIAEDLRQMEVEVSVDEADVGQVAAGQKANFTVDAFPGRRFPARVTRVNLGSNASTSSTGTTSSTATVVAYTAVLAVTNADEQLRPGMTASADILAREVKGAILVPNAALRFTPDIAAKNTGITSNLLPRMRRSGGNAREVNFGAGSRQTVYAIGADGTPQAINITIGESDGNMAAVTGGALKPGMKVITGQLAAGQDAATISGNGTAKRTGSSGNRANGN